MRTKLLLLIIALFGHILVAPPLWAESSTNNSRLPPAAKKIATELNPDCKIEANCLSQANAFQRSSDAANYLAIYEMYFNNDQTDKQKKATKQAFEDCLKNINCNEEKQSLILRASVRKNFGKEIRGMILTNDSNRESMRSLQNNLMLDPAHRVRAGRPKEMETPFKLKPEEVGDNPYAAENRKKLREEEILGPQFLSEYKAFLNNYAKTTDQEHWYYVAAKAPQTPGSTNRSDIIATNGEQKKPIIHQSYEQDKKNPLNKIVDHQVLALQNTIDNKGKNPKERADEIITKTQVLSGNTALTSLTDKNGKPLPGKDVHRVAVSKINSLIDETVKEKGKDSKGRDLASVREKNTVVNRVKIDMDKFTQFLDEIWPLSVGNPNKPKP